MSRKVARECAYKLIFEYLFGREINQRTYDIFCTSDLDDKDKIYLEKVYYGVINNYNDLTSTINKYSTGFAEDRIYTTDMSAMLLAIYEMKYMDDIPLGVSISEAVELVKRFSTQKSNQFVNGVLASVYKEIN